LTNNNYNNRDDRGVLFYFKYHNTAVGILFTINIFKK